MEADPKAILKWITEHPGAGPRDLESAFSGLSRSTLNRWIRGLADQGDIVSVRRGPNAAHYAADLKGYFEIPVVHRPAAPFNADWAVAGLPRFRADQLQRLKRAVPRLGATAEANAASVRKRLMIELSYASSKLEGNTYDLIETEALLHYGQEALGKTPQETTMIINHHQAIRYLLDNITSAGIDRPTILDVHALLSQGLLADANYEGRVRDRSVAITSSTYRPIDNQYQLDETLRALLTHVNAEPEPFNQSLMLMVGIAYLQPFLDCNKRTGRLMANLPLVQAGLPPLSFVTVDAAQYTRGLLAYYELGAPGIISAAYISGYIETARLYLEQSEGAQSTLAQQAFALKYRSFSRGFVQKVVRGEWPADAPLPDSVPTEDRIALANYLRDLLEKLHAGQSAIYGLRKDEISAFEVKRDSRLSNGEDFSPR